MNRDFKSFSYTNLKAKASGRVRVGVCAVMGNVDSWGDRIHVGAFAKTITENLNSVRHLWNHDYSKPPIARIVDLKEIGRDELPPEVLAKAPDATGGLVVSREYFNTALASEVLEAIDAGAINEMSFAYDVIKSSSTQEDTGFEDMPTRYIRELHELKLYDTSDVNWGMNGATVAVGAKNFNTLPLGAILSHLQFHQTQVKAGSRNSSADAALIASIHNLSVDLGATCSTEDSAKNADNPDNSKQAEAVENSDTSLSPNWLEMKKLEIEMLDF